MSIKVYQIDTFTDKVFAGNPAAVCPLENWLPDSVMQSIAMENNLAETAFYVKKGNQYEIRWFTPTVEVDLCGHATLASAFVLFNYENHDSNEIEFYSPRSGVLIVTKEGDLLSLNFPSDPSKDVEFINQMKGCFNVNPKRVLKGSTDYVFIYESASDIETIQPDLLKIKTLNARGVIVTAKGNDVDFVSRFFGPQCGIDEDPVTGSAHTTLIPYWSKQLNKNKLRARQLSPRGGYLECLEKGDRVDIKGKAKLYLKGEILID